MAIVRWDPFRELASLSEKLDKYLEGTEESWPKSLRGGDWSPAVDIQETDKALVITAEVPGIEDQDIEVEIEDHNLILKGKREYEKETKKENFRRVERSYGSFYRSFSLPDSVDLDKVEAVHDKGLLKITAPKKPDLTPRKIKVLPKAEAKK
jgi:HSP20 family protein